MDAAAKVMGVVVQTKTPMVRSFSEQKLKEQETCPIERLSRDYMSLSSSFLRALGVRNAQCSGFGTQHGVSSLAAAQTFPFQGGHSRSRAPPLHLLEGHLAVGHHHHPFEGVVGHRHGVDVAKVGAADAAADAASRQLGVAEDRRSAPQGDTLPAWERSLSGATNALEMILVLSEISATKLVYVTTKVSKGMAPQSLAVAACLSSERQSKHLMQWLSAPVFAQQEDWIFSDSWMGAASAGAVHRWKMHSSGVGLRRQPKPTG